MNIIFLDIDGVLCTKSSYKLPGTIIAGRNLDPLNDDCVACLNQITDATKALIVISSAWRINFWEPEEFDLLREYFKDSGVTGTLLDHTPYSKSRIRGREIQEWLDNHKVDKFIIIDDSIDMEHLLPNLIRTNSDDGLQKEHVTKAIETLNEQRI